MGFTYPPIVGDSELYNPRFYPSLGADGVLTYEYAQTLYLNKNDFRLSYLSGVIPGAATSGSALVLDETLSMSGLGSVSCSALTVAGVAVGTLPPFLDSITPGTAASNKALVLGASGEIATIASLTATSITGTLQTGAQPNITSIGTQSASIATSITNNTASLIQYALWTNSAPTPVSVRIQMSYAGATLLTPTTHPLRLGANGANIVWLQTSGNVSIGSDVNTHKLYVDGTLRATDIALGDTVSTTGGARIKSYIPNLAAGQVNSFLIGKSDTDYASIRYAVNGANKVLQLGLYGFESTITLSSTNCVGIRHSGPVCQLEFNGSIDDQRLIALYNNPAFDGLFRGFGIVSNNLQYHSGTNHSFWTGLGGTGNLATTGTERMRVASTLISCYVPIDATGYQLNGTSYDLALISRVNLTTLGVAEASKALVINASSSITSGLASMTLSDTLSATTLTGSLSTAAQTAITSVGTLTNLTLNTGGTGLFTPNLKFYNSTSGLYDNFNHSYFLGITLGGAVASKVLVVDSNKDIGSIRTLNAVNLNGSTQVSGTLGDFGSISISGTSIITSSRNIQNVGDIACSGTMNSFGGYQVLGTTVIDTGYNVSANLISGSTISQTQSIIQVPNTSISGGLSAASAYDLQFRNTINNANCTGGISFTIGGSANNASITPSASIIARSTSVASSTNFPSAQIEFWTREISTGIQGALTERLRVHDDGKISFSDITGDAEWNFLKGTTCSMRFGAALSTNNCFTWTHNYAGNNNAANRLELNSYGTQYALVIKNDGRVGVGTATPAAGFDVSAFASVSMTGPLATGTSSAYTVNRAGTFTDSVSIYCRQALMVGVRGAYIGSDRRVKENITTIPPEDGVKFVRDINPKLYDLIGFNKRQVGYISQDLMQDYSALISLLPDPNMTVEQEGDVDGAFLSLSYERVPAFLHAALKSVLDRLDEQDAIISELNNRLTNIENGSH